MGEIYVDPNRTWTNRMYFSADRVLDPGDGLMCEDRGTNQLGVDMPTHWACPASFTLTPIPPGNWQFIVVLDAENEVSEIDETNNVAAADTTV